MRKLLALVLVVLVVVSCRQEPEVVNLIPMPVDLKMESGKFKVNRSTTICCNDTSMLNVAQYLHDLLAKAGVQTQFRSEAECEGEKEFVDNSFIFSKLHDTLLGDEGYRLGISPKAVQIGANRAAGAFYAVQTIRQLMPPGFEAENQQFSALQLPCLQITDYPKFAWRGFLLDCSRHFMSKEFVMRYIDLLAYHKFNTLHWHLTDDQGWRIEIQAFPELTQKGAWRTEADGTQNGGFYTQHDIQQIGAHAKKQFVNIVPEIEMPGHSVAAIASYPELSCTGNQIEVETSWGVFKDILCPSKPFTHKFLQTVLTEICELFPTSKIHIGGDECPKYRWENCPDCRKSLKDKALSNYEELQRWLIDKVSRFLRTQKRSIIGWDEIMDGGLPQNATVEAWRGLDKVSEALQLGAHVIAMPTSHCYFDYPVGITPLSQAYSFDPIPPNTTPAQQKLILGGECALWSERAPQPTVDTKVFPRILAIGEVLWTYPSERNYLAFRQRVRKHYSRLTELGVHYGFEQSAVQFHDSLAPDGRWMQVRIEGGREYFDIRYTTNGSEPTAQSAQYQQPIIIKKSTNLLAAAFSGNTQVDEVFSNRVVISKTSGKPLKLNYIPAKQYLGGGQNALVDGRQGTDYFNDGIWQAVQGTSNMQATVDLQQAETLSKFAVRFLQSNPSWIFAPAKVEFFTSNDGEAYTLIASVLSPVKPRDGGNIIHNFEATVPPTKARFVRMVASSIGPCPEWHPAAGAPSWLFADEFVVE